MLEGSTGVGWTLVIAGLVLVVIGLGFILGPSRPWLGHLPGDVSLHKGNVHFYFPIATCVLVSLLLSLILWIVRALSR